MIPTKVLVTGSRDATPEMLAAVSRHLRGLKGRNAHIIVGDASGIDDTVIQTCDEIGLSIEAHGAYKKMRRRTMTGRNITHDTDYLGRDTLMAQLLGPGDICVAVWDGIKINSGTVATARRAARTCCAVYWLWKSPYQTVPSSH